MSHSVNKQLGMWVTTQRSQYRLLQEGKQSTMSEDREYLLESIVFLWELVSKDSWTQHFQNLKKYATKEGHCNVPRIYSENKQLGMWVSNQRSQYRRLQEGKQSTMTEDKKSLLEFIGFVWELRSKDTWMQRFKDIKKYATKERHCNVLRNYSENKQLRMWVNTQRSQYRFLQ